MRSRLYAAALAALFLAACAAEQPAAAEETFDRVSFGVQRTREVENDWLIATIGVTHESEDPAELAARVNADMTWALERAKGVEGVEVRTASYRTHPISDPKRGKLVRWRGGQDLVLESGDAKALSELLGRLQERLQLRGLQQSVSRELRERVEGELLVELIDAWRARAERIAEHMGARGFRLVELRLDGSSPPHPVPLQSMRAMAVEMDRAPPPIEPGTSQLSLGASATIALQR